MTEENDTRYDIFYMYIKSKKKRKNKLPFISYYVKVFNYWHFTFIAIYLTLTYNNRNSVLTILAFIQNIS